MRLKSTIANVPIIHLEILPDRLEKKLAEMTEGEEDERREKGKGKQIEMKDGYRKKESVKAKNRLREEMLLQRVVEEALDRGVFLIRPLYVAHEKFSPRPSIRIALSSQHQREHIEKAVAVIKESAAAVLN